MSRQNPSPEQIEHEISATRAEIDETLDALQNKLSPGQLLDQALGYAKEGGGEFAANFGRRVRDNPLPVALLGIGVGWLMMSGRSSAADHGRDAYDRDPRRSVDPETRAQARASGPGSGFSGFSREIHAERRSADSGVAVSGATRPTRSGGADFTGKTGATQPSGAAYSGTAGSTQTGGSPQAGKAGSSEQGLKDRASAAASDIKQSGEVLKSRVGDKASEMVGSVKERADEAGERLGEMRDEVGERIASAREMSGEYADRAREGLSRARDSAGRYFHENPLVVGALALAAGAALGALLPATRREGEFMGEHSDAAKAAARDAVAEGAEKAKTVAAAAMESGKDEARRQGITVENAEKITKAGVQVAKTAGRSAESELKKAVSTADTPQSGRSGGPPSGKEGGRTASTQPKQPGSR